MRYLSLCSGIEAASVAWMPLGWVPVAFAEIEAFPAAVLAHHYPNVPNLGNINEITQQQIEDLGHIDAVIFGFPCQDLSGAGKRKGLKNADGTFTRSGLFFKCEQISRWAKARWTVAENVLGLFSIDEGRAFATVVGELAGAEVRVPRDGWPNSGVALGPKGLVEFTVLDAQYAGLAQRRKRCFFVRDSGDWSNRPPVLLISESMFRDPAPRRTPRQSPAAAAQGSSGSGRVAPTLDARAGRSGETSFATSGELIEQGCYELAPPILSSGRGTERAGETRGQDCVIPIQEIGKRESGTPMNGVGHGQPGDPMYTLQASAVHGVCAPEQVVHTLRAEHDASENGTGRGTPLVATKQWPVDVAPTLNAHFGTKQGLEDQHALGGVDSLYPPVSMCLNAGAMGRYDAETETLLPMRPGGFFDEAKPQGFNIHSANSCAMKGMGSSEAAIVTDTARAIDQAGWTSNQGGTVALQQEAGPRMAVRRLIPEECEKLQGFSVGYTKIPVKKVKRERLLSPRCGTDYVEINGEVWQLAADGPRYKALGNSFATPVVRWIGLRIQAATKATHP